MNLLLIAVVVAVLAVVGNMGQAWLYLGLRDELTSAKDAVKSIGQQRDTALADAMACGNAVDELHNLAEQRAKEATTARATAAAQAHAAAQRADAILAAPAAVPGDDCQSAQVRVERWLQTRGNHAP
ncbi:MAG: hypothetical protein K2Y10_05700 [Burkholderiaceae bacterium]|nr:hypothetical protein [Burkholderiaceae bacterium]